MEGSLAKELYSEALQSTVVGSHPTSTVENDDEDDLWHGDGSSWEGSMEELGNTSDLSREWQRRRDQFHTIGYRDGLIEGKEASSQEGFNIGFRESLFDGYNWGLTRGVTSALASLPDGLRERLIATQDKRDEFHSLHGTVQSISTADALKLYNDGLVNKSVEQHEYSGLELPVAHLRDQSLNGNLLGQHYKKLQSLVLESLAIEIEFQIH